MTLCVHISSGCWWRKCFPDIEGLGKVLTTPCGRNIGMLQNKAQDLYLDSSFETTGRPLWAQWWNFGFYEVLFKRQPQTAAVTKWYEFYVVGYLESSVYLACVRLCVVRCGMGRVISCHLISKIYYYWIDSINTRCFTYRSSYSTILLNMFRYIQMYLLKEHVVFSVTLSLTRIQFEMCLLIPLLPVLRGSKYWKSGL